MDSKDTDLVNFLPSSDGTYSLIQDPSKSLDLSVIKEACLVVDILGTDYRNHVIERYVNTELRDYRRIFASSGEVCSTNVFLNLKLGRSLTLSDNLGVTLRLRFLCVISGWSYR